MHWSSQKCLEFMIISTAMSCTILVCAHCIETTGKNDFSPLKSLKVVKSKEDVEVDGGTDRGGNVKEK